MKQDQLLLFDGAMGTMLHRHGITQLSIPEELNFQSPDIIQSIHREYLENGADVITTHTFGANAYKLSMSSYSVEDVIKKAIDNAKIAKGESDALIALDIGPIGRLMKPVGDMDFDTAYSYFKEQVVAGEKNGIDLILIETMADLGEIRAAVLAAKEHATCPVFATMTFEEGGISLTGTDPENMILALEALGVDALGVNCSLGPEKLLPIIRRILNFTKLPVVVQANAGIPYVENGETIFSVESDQYTEYCKLFANEGVQIIGGCCGTTPEYIQKINKIRDQFKPRQIKERDSFISSSQQKISLDSQIIIIGERINPSGNRSLKPAFLAGDITPAARLAFEQMEAGAHILDVGTELPGVDSIDLMKRVIDQFNGLITAPLQFDSTNPELLEVALRRYSGVAIINSVNANTDSMESIFPLMKKYGAYAVALTLDEKGIPKTAEKRLDIAQRLIQSAEEYGLSKDRFLFDPLVLTASAQQAAVGKTLAGIRLLTETLGVKTTLGLSNVSFGLPGRPLLNRTFLAMALTNGLSSVIIDPGAPGIKETLMSFNVLSNRDQDSTEYINTYGGVTAEPTELIKADISLDEALLKGDAQITKDIITQLLNEHDPLWIVENYLVIGLDNIGKDYEKKTIYLPQLIRAAETAGVAFQLIRDHLIKSDQVLESKGTIVLATVKGDVHDLGKNLVKVLLENYGYTVIDCGRDVSTELLIETIKANDVKMVGLSALMTTTVANMVDSIKAIKETFKDLPIIVGGAVLTREYALSIGADAYGKDSREAVEIVKNFLK